jgi:DNA polymerase III subunit epsilon
MTMSVLDQSLVFVDIETNGLNHIRGRVIEVAAIRVENGRIVKEYRQFINPGAPLPQFITNLTGIRSADLDDAPLFMGIAGELQAMLADAIFVAHNVRFDYSFLKQEFKRIGQPFSPDLLCTVRLSRALYPEHRGHKLQDLITRHNLEVSARHRAYDDAHALWQFVQHVRSNFELDIVEQAIAKQLRKPSLPKSLAPETLESLPTGTGVYIMEDAAGQPIYVGKSVHIKKRVASHFTRDHDNVGEFNISQNVHNIRAQQTTGELEALLLESQLVKQLQPLYNKKLRKTEKLTIARQATDAAGYLTISLEEASQISTDDVPNILAVYTRRSLAKNALDELAKDYQLCPKLLGLEKSKGACFQHQLHRCKGACVGKEPAALYNARLKIAFNKQHIQEWPFASPVLVEEKTVSQESSHAIVVDRWCVVAEIKQAQGCDPEITEHPRTFDLDTYNIIRSFITTKLHSLTIRPISFSQLQQLAKPSA